MASYPFVKLAILAILLPLSLVTATEYIVGDGNGWTIDIDYQAWAQGKTFYVGDKLVFQYTPPNHNVFKVNGTSFQDCIVPPVNEALNTGNDTITLAASGKKWYICGVKKHCAEHKQKLSINVLAQAPTPAPNAASYNGFMTSGFGVFVAAIVSVATALA